MSKGGKPCHLLSFAIKGVPIRHVSSWHGCRKANAPFTCHPSVLAVEVGKEQA
jgi:hypothetical protein